MRTVAIIIILVITGFLIFSNIKINQKKDKIDIQLAALEKEISNLQEKNKELKEGISSVGDESYIEKIARQDMGLQKEGEKVVSFITPSEQEETKEKQSSWGPGDWWQWIKKLFGK